MKIRMVDLETTGLPEDQVKAICEIGWTDVAETGQILQFGSFLVNPGHPIPPQTRAIHHISDADVVGAVTPTEGTTSLMNGMEPGDMFAAHNMAFEREFFGGGSFPWICTLKCAQHLFPDAPSHSNQVLRYWLGVDQDAGFDVNLAMPPHRAGPDTYVSAFLLRRLLMLAPPAELHRLSFAPVLLRKISFGKHRGQDFTELPTSYLQWMVGQQFDADVLHTARHHLRERGL